MNDPASGSRLDGRAPAARVLAALDQAVIGQREAAEGLLAAYMAGGHVLIEGVPGIGKTLLARLFAAVLGLRFTRIQFTPDLMPTDILGMNVFDQASLAFRLVKGPVFTQILMADEINRTPPKTQSALLEAMQEGQVTVEGETFPLPRPFHVLATANPVEYEGTYPLPEAQLDRFLLRVSFGYPTPQEEWEVLQRRMGRRQEAQTVGQVTDAEGLLAMQQAIEGVTVDETVGQYCVRLVDATRRHQHLLMGASPRGSLALLLTARAYAVVQGRDYVTPEDVKAVAHAALDHRVTVRPELWMNEVTSSTVVEAILSSTATPGATTTASGVASSAGASGFERPASAFTRP